MKRKNLRVISYILISISFFCFVIGYFIDKNQNKLTFTNIKITSNNTKNNPKDVLINNNKKSKEKITEDNQVFTNSIFSLEEVNENLRQNIEEKYNINIKYGNEITNYSVGGMSIETINDEESINSALNKLNYNISLYPDGFFNEFSKQNLKLNIYLIKKFSEKNVTGITDTTSNNVVITIATDYNFSTSFNHEIYHYIERYINLSGGAYKTWNNLNPKDFSYGKSNKQYTYTSTNSPDSYFVNIYAEESEFEDRASTFEYMMSTNKINAFNKGNRLYLKAKYICNQINLFFDTVNENVVEYWERFIY